MTIQPNVILPKNIAVKEYAARVNQNGTSIPSNTIVLKNSYKYSIYWTRTSAGLYVLNSNNEFTLGYTIFENMTDALGTSRQWIPISDGTAITGYYSIFVYAVNKIKMEWKDNTWAAADMGTILGSLGHLYINFKTYT